MVDFGDLADEFGIGPKREVKKEKKKEKKKEPPTEQCPHCKRKYENIKKHIEKCKKNPKNMPKPLTITRLKKTPGGKGGATITEIDQIDLKQLNALEGMINHSTFIRAFLKIMTNKETRVDNKKTREIFNKVTIAIHNIFAKYSKEEIEDPKRLTEILETEFGVTFKLPENQEEINA